MLYREFCAKFSLNDDGSYTGYVLNSGFNETFTFNDIDDFEKESIIFIDKYYQQLMDQSENIEFNLDEDILHAMRSVCERLDISLIELITNILKDVVENGIDLTE